VLSLNIKIFLDVFSNISYIVGPFFSIALIFRALACNQRRNFMKIYSPLQYLQGPLHAVGLVKPNEPVIVNSIAKPVFETMQVGANYVASKLTPSKLVKAGVLFGAVQALSSVPGADAGFALFALCMSTCLAAGTGTGGALWPMCVAICCPTAPAPTP
jgi:hypothetical protein